MREIFLKNLNSKIYIKNTKDLVMLYDSHKEPLTYYEREDLLSRAEQNELTFKEQVEQEIEYLENARDIAELLHILGLCECEIITKEEVEMDYVVNYVGEYVLLFY